jgi:hypothetical protein
MVALSTATISDCSSLAQAGVDGCLASNACHQQAASIIQRRKPLMVAALGNGNVRCLYPNKTHSEQWILPPKDRLLSACIKPVLAKVSGTKLTK